MTGWIKLHRQFLEWEWYTDLNSKTVFLHCLLKANHTEKNWRGMIIERGSFITSLKNLALETGLSAQNVRTALLKLKSTGEINKRTTSLNTYITVVNYEDYQSSNKPLTNDQLTTNKQTTTTKNEKNDENEKNSVQLAEKIYQAYPRKVGKKKAIQAIVKAMNEVDIDELLAKVNMFSKSVIGQEAKYIPHPATWFNEGRWEDDTDDWTAWKRNDEDTQENTPQYLSKRLG